MNVLMVNNHGLSGESIAALPRRAGLDIVGSRRGDAGGLDWQAASSDCDLTVVDLKMPGLGGMRA